MNVQKKLAFALIRAKLNSLAIINRKKAGEEAFKLFSTPPYRHKKKSELFLSAEILQLKLNQTLVKGYRFNHPREKKVMILHGFTSSSQNFEKYIKPLMQKGYEILAFDAPAHGVSEGKTVNAVEYSEMILEVIREYGPIDAFIAHSFGGLAVCLAMEKIKHGPETKIVLIAPATETTTAIISAFKILGLKNPILKKGLEDTILAKSSKNAEWYSIRRAMHNIKATVLWCHDEDDDTTPLSDALKVKEDGHKNITFRISNGLGHRKIYRDEAVKKEIFEFLS